MAHDISVLYLSLHYDRLRAEYTLIAKDNSFPILAWELRLVGFMAQRAASLPYAKLGG